MSLIQANALQIPLSDESVNCCVTSPPYFGLRDYGNDDQLGLEETPEAYVANMVAVFREVWRVLRDDGTLWLNLGDSYATGTKAARQEGTLNLAEGTKKARRIARIGTPVGRKTKDLIGVPWLVAFALQRDGWYLRSDIIWHKPNCMPESVTDRPTKAHEYVFLLAKQPRYWYDADAVREKAISGSDLDILRGRSFVDGKNVSWHAKSIRKRQLEGVDSYTAGTGYRNKRTVWTVATQPTKAAHFATFPPKLIEPMILAGCPEGGIVLDPFAGSGTTVQVARNLGRRAVGLDLSAEYLDIAQQRTCTEFGGIAQDDGQPLEELPLFSTSATPRPAV